MRPFPVPSAAPHSCVSNCKPPNAAFLALRSQQKFTASKCFLLPPVYIERRNPSCLCLLSANGHCILFSLWDMFQVCQFLLQFSGFLFCGDIFYLAGWLVVCLCVAGVFLLFVFLFVIIAVFSSKVHRLWIYSWGAGSSLRMPLKESVYKVVLFSSLVCRLTSLCHEMPAGKARS